MKNIIYLFALSLLTSCTSDKVNSDRGTKLQTNLQTENLQPGEVPYSEQLNTILHDGSLSWLQVHQYYTETLDEHSDKHYTDNRKKRITARLFLKDTENQSDFTEKYAAFYLNEIAAVHFPDLKLIARLLDSGKLNVEDSKTQSLVRASLKKWEEKKDLSKNTNRLYLEGKAELDKYLIK